MGTSQALSQMDVYVFIQRALMNKHRPLSIVCFLSVLAAKSLTLQVAINYIVASPTTILGVSEEEQQRFAIEFMKSFFV
jgi:hypothetical protein